MTDGRLDAKDREVPELRWEDVRKDWTPDGSELRDIYVFDTSDEDWQRILTLVAERWSYTYTLDSEPTALPSSMQEVWENRASTTIALLIEPRKGIEIMCYFFDDTTIEFDLHPSAVVSQADLDAVCGFVRAVGETLRKPVLVCYEGRPLDESTNMRGAIMRYDPAADAVVRVPPPDPTSRWERFERWLEDRS